MKFKSFKDYILFLYIHVAYADGEVHEKERELIMQRIQHLFPGELDPAGKFDEMVNAYMQDAGNSEESIRGAHTQFNNVEFYKKYKVFRDLYDIIHADGVVSETETEALEKLKQVIGIEIEHQEG